MGASLIAACATGTPISDTMDDAGGGGGSVDAAAQDSTTAADSGSYDTPDSGTVDGAAID